MICSICNLEMLLAHPGIVAVFLKQNGSFLKLMRGDEYVCFNCQHAVIAGLADPAEYGEKGLEEYKALTQRTSTGWTYPGPDYTGAPSHVWTYVHAGLKARNSFYTQSERRG